MLCLKFAQRVLFHDHVNSVSDKTSKLFGFLGSVRPNESVKNRKLIMFF